MNFDATVRLGEVLAFFGILLTLVGFIYRQGKNEAIAKTIVSQALVDLASLRDEVKEINTALRTIISIEVKVDSLWNWYMSQSIKE